MAPDLPSGLYSTLFEIADDAVIVVDAAVRRRDGRTVFLLAQSYMPAQEIQVLANPNDTALSPWYAAGFGNELRTPEWTFADRERTRFGEERAEGR